MKLRKKFLLSLSVLPLIGLAVYFFVQKPNICTREYFGDNSRKYSFCKISDDYLKVNKPNANNLIKTYEYLILNKEYYNDDDSFILSRQLLLFQGSGYWINLYNILEDNLKNDDEYYKTLLGYFKYDANYVYPYDGSVGMYLIKGDTTEEYQKNHSGFQSSLNSLSESLIQQIGDDMPTYKWADFHNDIIQFICIILSFIVITLFSILTLKKTKSIPIFFATVIFESLIFCCCFDLFNELPHTLLSMLHILLGLILIGISGTILLKILKKESHNLFIQKEHSMIYTNILSIIKILTLISISLIYLCGIDTIFRGGDLFIHNGIIWLDVIVVQLIWLGFDVYLSTKLIKYIKNSHMKKWIIALLISSIIITFICKLMTINIIDIPGTSIIYTISFIVCIINIIIYVFWANTKLIKLNKYLINLFPKYSKIINKKSEEFFE